MRTRRRPCGLAEVEAQLSALCEAGLKRRQPAGPEHCGGDKVLPGLTWGRDLHQGKAGKSLTAPFSFNYAEDLLPDHERSRVAAIYAKARRSVGMVVELELYLTNYKRDLLKRSLCKLGSRLYCDHIFLQVSIGRNPASLRRNPR